MVDLAFETIEQQLAAALPELRPAADYYWKTQGAPGSDHGAYIFFEDMFARYVEVLLALRASPRRDELLRRAFAFVEEMLGSPDSSVRDLAFIGLYEGRAPWWFARALPSLGHVRRSYWTRSSPPGETGTKQVVRDRRARSVMGIVCGAP